MRITFSKSRNSKTTSAFEEKTQKMLTCDMKYPKLQTELIPSQFPNCPSYLSKSLEKPRLSKTKLVQKKKQDQLAGAIQQSKEKNKTFVNL